MIGACIFMTANHTRDLMWMGSPIQNNCLIYYAWYILTPFQSGFIPKDFTTNGLHLYHIFCKSIDRGRGKEVRAVFCDINMVFDRVWHNGLLLKLKNIGRDLNRWLESYPSNRKQRVVINGQTSGWINVGAGVSQGSFLSPLPFLTYINDIVRGIESPICLFADDTNLYISVGTLQLAAESLNSDLLTINSCANDWLVDLNLNKTVSLLVSRKSIPTHHPPLYFNNVMIQETNSYEHVGLTFSDLFFLISTHKNNYEDSMTVT